MTPAGVDEQYASRHSAWLHCPARDSGRSCRVVRGFAVRAALAATPGGGGACPRGHRSPWMNGALSRAPHDRSAQNTLARRRGRSNSHAQLAIASSSAGAAYRNPGGPLAVRRQPYKSGDQPVDLDDDHASRAGARASRSGRPFRTRICRGARADQMAIAKPSASPPRSRSRRRSPPTRGGRSRPAGPSTAETNVPARAGELAQYAADGVPRARSHVTAARTKERFSPHR